MLRNGFVRMLAAVVAILLPRLGWTEAFDYSAYNAATIPEVLTHHSTVECRTTERNAYILSAHVFKYRIGTAFTSQLRPLTPEVKESLRLWGKAFPPNQKVSETSQHELLVRDGLDEYWVPIQEQLLPFMADELTIGQDVELYIAVLGAVHTTCVFVATEFRAVPN